MSELGEGVSVRVRSLNRRLGVLAVVIRDEGETVRVRFVDSGKKRTVKRERIIGERARPRAGRLVRTPAPYASFHEQFLGPIPKTPPKRDRKYLEHVRARPCCVCGSSPPNDAHHFGPRGMGQKTDDRRTVPLCRQHHDEWHTRGTIGWRVRDAVESDFYRAMVDALLAYADRIS